MNYMNKISAGIKSIKESKRIKLNYRMKELIIGAAVLAALGGGMRACNNSWNNRIIEKPTHYTTSYATGLTGHVEYTRYTDGSQDVKRYPGLGHRLWDSELHQDLDGDGLVDRIRKNGAEWKMNRLNELLIREYDYDDNQERFDSADKQLQELAAKYSR